MPPSSATMTGIAGETMVWLTAATSMPSISPTKITVLWFEPLSTISPPPVFRGLGQHTEHPPQLPYLLRTQHRADTPIEPLATIEEALDQAPPLLGQVHPYHSMVPPITLPSE